MHGGEEETSNCRWGRARARLRTLAKEEEAGTAVGVASACTRATASGGEQKAPSSPPLVDAPERREAEEADHHQQYQPQRQARVRVPRATAGQAGSSFVAASDDGGPRGFQGGVHPARSAARSEQMMPAASATATATHPSVSSVMAPGEWQTEGRRGTTGGVDERERGRR